MEAVVLMDFFNKALLAETGTVFVCPIAVKAEIAYISQISTSFFDTLIAYWTTSCLGTVLESIEQLLYFILEVFCDDCCRLLDKV